MAWEGFADTSKVWIYSSSEIFLKEESLEIQIHLDNFCKNWTSHNNQLLARGKVLHDRFIVLMVDESRAGASGCSIDKSVAFVKLLEEKYNKDLFNRMNFTYIEKEELKSLSKEDFKNAFSSGSINEATPVFDNLVKTKKEFEEAWIKPLSQSWHKRFI